MSMDKGADNQPKHGLDWVDWDLQKALAELPDASPVLVYFCQGWNMTQGPHGDPVREGLRAVFPRLLGTAGDEAREERRAWLVRDWLLRVNLAAWVRAAGLDEQAAALADLPPQRDVAALYVGAPAWHKAHQVARVITTERFLDHPQAQAKGSDWYARWSAAEVGARGAALYAGYPAGNIAAWSAVNYLHKAHPGEGLIDPSGEHDTATLAASLAGREAASQAVNDAATEQGWDAHTIFRTTRADDVAFRAAFAVLQPTIAELQASAWQLFEAMVAGD